MTAALVCAAAGMLFFAPQPVEQSIRAAVLDVVTPGQAFTLERVRRCRQACSSWFAAAGAKGTWAPARHFAEPTVSGARIAELEREQRHLIAENARLQAELKLAERYGVSPFPVPESAAVRNAQVLRAAVVSGQALAAQRRLAQLDRGRLHGVPESAPVVEDDGLPHIDQGSEAGLEQELDVFAGRCMVGRILNVGRWSSSLELLTDRRYRALAQIVRPSDQGGSFGAEGILSGQGTELCKLADVPTTQTVRVGDEVYTSDRDGRMPVPLYYGRVVRVEEAGRNWDITVEPAVKANELKWVVVIKLPSVSGGGRLTN